jgi:hypothetical protein
VAQIILRGLGIVRVDKTERDRHRTYL